MYGFLFLFLFFSPNTQIPGCTPTIEPILFIELLYPLYFAALIICFFFPLPLIFPSPDQVYCHVPFAIAETKNTSIHFPKLYIYSKCISFLAWVTMMYFNYNQDHQQIVLQSVTHSQEEAIGNLLHWRTVIKHLEYYSTSRFCMICLAEAICNNDFLKMSLPTRLCNKLRLLLSPECLMHVTLWSIVSVIHFTNDTVQKYLYLK